MIGKLPDFLIVGCQKSGTTFLGISLQKHDDVYMRPWEVHFFDREFHRGIEWYKSLFDSDKICGEQTPRYVLTDKWVERIYNAIPNAKLIFIMRNPVERAYSQYQHYVRKGWDLANVPFEEALKYKADDPCSILNRGLYLQQLQRLFKYYDESSIHIMVMEELEIDSLGELNKMCSFLGVGEYNYDINFKRNKYEPMLDETRHYLSEFYESSNAKLYEFLGRNLKWQ
jgi:hypothetical protein